MTDLGSIRTDIVPQSVPLEDVLVEDRLTVMMIISHQFGGNRRHVIDVEQFLG